MNRFRSISRRLTRSVFIWATGCALLISAGQAAYSYRHVQLEFESAVREIGETHVPLLSVSIWDIEPDAVRLQVERIAARREIGYVVLSVATGQVFSSGTPELAGQHEAREFLIPQPGRPKASVGKLEVYANPSAFYREVVYRVGAVIAGYGVLTLLICTLVVVLIRRELERPLQTIARFVANLTPERLTTPLKLDRPARLERDEIDLVVEGFQVLQDGIQGHITNLDHMVAQRTEELEVALASIHELSQVDPLTGCLNRRSFSERIAREIERAVRYQRPLSVVFTDLDYFKAINDTYGHHVGDQVLRAVAACLKEALRADIDWVARFGGEEFVVVMPETDERSAVVSAERLRLAIAACTPVAEYPLLKLTASFGVAQFVAGESADDLVRRADNMLYAAKDAGRNRTLPCIES